MSRLSVGDFARRGRGRLHRRSRRRRSEGYSREVYHTYATGDPDTRRTEVQERVIAAAVIG